MCIWICQKYQVSIIRDCSVYMAQYYCLGNRSLYVLIDIYPCLGYTWDRIDTYIGLDRSSCMCALNCC